MSDLPAAESTRLSDADTAKDSIGDNLTNINVSLPSFKEPVILQESSLGDETLRDSGHDDDGQDQQTEPKFEIVQDCSTRGRPKLFDNCGHSYTIKSKNG